MREIEFRAWDKEINEMIFQQKRSPCFGRFEGENWCSLEDVLFYYKQSFVLMQYTGLKDKNGTKIYEGDIVIHNGEIKTKIDWDDEEAGFKYFIGHGGGIYSNKNYTTKYVEVIGNIYENPELLVDENSILVDKNSILELKFNFEIKTTEYENYKDFKPIPIGLEWEIKNKKRV